MMNIILGLFGFGGGMGWLVGRFCLSGWFILVNSLILGGGKVVFRLLVLF